MNIIDFLIEDHERICKQLVMVRRCLLEGCLRDKIEGLIKSYKLHESIEERILFPPLLDFLIDFPERRALISEYEKSHKDVWDLMKRVKETLEFSRFEALQQAFFEFSAAAEMHLREEERVLFPMVRGYLQQETLEELGNQAEECRCAALKAEDRAAHLLETGTMRKPDRILVPLDFSRASSEALDIAALIAGQVGSEIILLAVDELPMYEGYPGNPIALPDPKETERQILSLFNQRMEGWPKDPPFPYGQRLKVLARSGSVIDHILGVANGMHADMIVMGTHGRKGFSRAILGSVTEQIIRQAPCPVLAIRAGMSALHEEGAAPAKVKAVK